MSPGPDRRRAERFGRRGEGACVMRLRLGGWRILACNWRVPVGEIDIVARRGRVLAFVEVKARGLEFGADPVPVPAQQRRITRAAEMFLAHHAALGACFGRFDVMFVGPWPSFRFFWPTHVVDAWRQQPR